MRIRLGVTPEDLRARIARRRSMPAPASVVTDVGPVPPLAAVPHVEPSPPADTAPAAGVITEVIELDGEVVFALDLADHGVEVQGWSVVTITGELGSPSRRVVIRSQDGEHYSVSLHAWRDVARSGRLAFEPSLPEEVGL